MDPRLYPQGSTPIVSGDVVTSLTTTDYMESLSATGNTRRQFTIANAFTYLFAYLASYFFSLREQTVIDVADNKTVALADCGIVQSVSVDAKVVTLPATAVGLAYTIVNGGADGAVLVTISPAAADKISGMGLTPADDKDLLNTKATAKRGDFVTLVADGVDGWVVTAKRGTWARQS